MLPLAVPLFSLTAGPPPFLSFQKAACMTLRSIAANSPVRRSHWLALGLTQEDLLKPKIAVVNSSSELAVCYAHLDGVAKVVKEAIRAAGGVPFEVRTTAPSDFITGAARRGGYILAGRDLIPNDIEAQVEAALLDGMVCLTSCDKTPPGHLMAAMRLNIPTLLVIGGYQPAGRSMAIRLISRICFPAAWKKASAFSASIGWMISCRKRCAVRVCARAWRRRTPCIAWWRRWACVWPDRPRCAPTATRCLPMPVQPVRGSWKWCCRI